jgi:hypothetical protein
MAKLRKYGQRSRADRRKDAELRQEIYNKLTPQQRLDKLPENGAKKERTKLEHLIRFGRKINTPATPSKTIKHKNTKPSRRERWENKKNK